MSLPYITCHNSLASDKLTKNTCNYVKLAATVQYKCQSRLYFVTMFYSLFALLELRSIAHIN